MKLFMVIVSVISILWIPQTSFSRLTDGKGSDLRVPILPRPPAAALAVAKREICRRDFNRLLKAHRPLEQLKNTAIQLCNDPGSYSASACFNAKLIFDSNKHKFTNMARAYLRKGCSLRP